MLLRVGAAKAFRVVLATVALGLAAGLAGAPGSTKAASPTAQELASGALKSQAAILKFRSVRVEMLHERRVLNLEKKRAAERERWVRDAKGRLEQAIKKGAPPQEIKAWRRDLETVDENIDEVYRQLAREVTYERCLFVGNRAARPNLDSKTRIDRIEVRSLDVPPNEIPKTGLGVVVTEGMGGRESLCAGYGYGRGAGQAYLQSGEFFPWPQDFGRIPGDMSAALSGRLRGDRIIKRESREGSQVYVVEISSFGTILCKAWIDPGHGFCVPRLELYAPPSSVSQWFGTGRLSKVMECSRFVYLQEPRLYFPLVTKYTRYGSDGKPDSVDIYKVFGPKYVAFNEKIDQDEFKIAFKRGMELEDIRRPGHGKYYADGLKADLFVSPSELAALVDRGDPRIVGGSPRSRSR